MEENINLSIGQKCFHCGQLNANSNAFCQGCGKKLHEPTGINQTVVESQPVAINQPVVANAVNESANLNQSMEPVAQKSGSIAKTLLTIVGLLACLGAMAGAGYFGYNYKQKKDAKAYIQAVSADFSKTVEDINKLSTENRLEDKDDNIDLFTKKLEEEKNRVDIAKNDIKNGKNNLNNQKAGKLVSATDSLVRQYYDESTEKVDSYGQALDYEIVVNKEMSKFVIQVDKMKAEVKAINNLEELKKSLTFLRDTIDAANNSLKAMTVPSGREESHNKTIKFFESFSINLTNMLNAIAENNQAKFIENANKLDEFLVDDKSLKDVDQLEDYYYDEIHKKFSSLREKADKIKSELIGYKTTLKAEVPDMNIEGW